MMCPHVRLGAHRQRSAASGCRSSSAHQYGDILCLPCLLNNGYVAGVDCLLYPPRRHNEEHHPAGDHLVLTNPVDAAEEQEQENMLKQSKGKIREETFDV